jgi:hypothetical protein
MAVDNPRVRARRELEELGLSMESALYLVDDRPPGGWDSLVTKDELRAEMAEIRTEIANLASELRKEMRDQTRWLTGVLLVCITIVSTIAGGVAGAVVRFA